MVHSDEYLRQAVMTASPEQLQLMLFDGAIRFARQAREALTSQDWETACEKLIRAQQIVAEMQNGLRHEINPSLCDQMAAIFSFIHRRLVDANISHQVEPLDEALRILEYQRETWRMLMDKILQESAASATHDGDRAESLCVQI